MALFDIFSKRQRKIRGDVPDVYQYDELPSPLRVQIVHIFEDLIGSGHTFESREAYGVIHDMLAREYGVFTLRCKDPSGNRTTDFISFFLQAEDVEEALDCVETAIRFAVVVHGDYVRRERLGPRASLQDGIDELNARFREHGVGYQFESGEIIRVDSQVIHQDAVKPVLRVLHDKAFSAAEREFLRAHEHYRHGRREEAIADALKSIESTLKVICARRRWVHKETDTAKTLINIVFENKMIPAYLQSEFSSLRTTLESGVPTVRNKVSGHGAGDKPRELPDYLVSYVLHMTASTVLFLVNAEATLP